MFEQGTVLMLRRTQVGQARQALGPGQGGAFARGEVGGFFPDAEGLQTRLGFPGLARIVGVHVDAVRAAIDLRGPQADQLKQRRFQPGLTQGHLQTNHGLVGFWCVFGPFNTIAHPYSPVSARIRRRWRYLNAARPLLE
ncbi:hypothetical protein D3C79_899040 [compost metagenome]